MKKAFSLLLCTVLFLSLCSCSIDKTPVLDNSENSYFVDFYTEGDTVYIECVLNILNPNNTETEVSIYATDEEDVEIGLLESPRLTAVDKESGEDTFSLKSGENTVTVLFKGDYAGIFQITQRDLPRFISIEVK